MGYIIKNTSGLINSRLTDTARKKLSQGNFNISYFQIGDSEVTYNTLSNTYNQFETMILEPGFNSQNSAGSPESNKQYIKYPYYVAGSQGNTYGVPFMDSRISNVFNTAAIRGFFYADLNSVPTVWSALTSADISINTNFIVDMTTLTGSTTIDVIYNSCNESMCRLPQPGDIVTIYYNGVGGNNCSCEIVPTPTPTASPTPSPFPCNNCDPCETPAPTPTPTGTPCLPTPPRVVCTPPQPTQCVMSMTNCYPILTYRIVSFCNFKMVVDRPTPNFSYFQNGCYGRIMVYPSGMTQLYDSTTPRPHWNEDVINFESVCDVDQKDVRIWNMNIPWSENPAGLISSTYIDYNNFGSKQYLGSKEYYGYASDSGQTDSSYTYFNNSFGDIIEVKPKDQKTIAIVHYTNFAIDFFYGEKFAMQPHDDTNPADTTGEARNFRVNIPWLMWHKSPVCCSGQTFWVDPPNFEEFNLFQVQYLQSTKNNDMNSPGLRYFHLWDENPNLNGYPSRIGKVFPDDKIIVIDDEEIIAAMSYKSNRNWTLPSPRVTLVTPNTCNSEGESETGLLTANTEYVYVTYVFSSSTTFTNYLHCNYYTKVQGPNLDCSTSGSQNIAIRFGNEFSCLNVPDVSPADINGYLAEYFYVLVQKVSGDTRPNSSEWKLIDKTSLLDPYKVNGFINSVGMTSVTFTVNQDEYDAAPFYDLNDQIPLTELGQTGITLNFGDEYYFYGSLESDIQATIYEMRYKINLGAADFQNTSNPTWTPGTSSYITDIGLYDSDKNLMIISKMQSPVLRTGLQQFLIKFDF